MKKSNLVCSIFFMVLLLQLTINLPATSQEATADKTTILQLEPFSEIFIRGAIELSVIQSDSQNYAIHVPGEQRADIKTEVREKALHMKSIPGRDFNFVKLKVITPVVNRIEASGKASIKNDGVLKGDSLVLIAGGTTSSYLNLDYRALFTKTSGAADLFLSGEAESHYIEAGGASKVDAKRLETINTRAYSRGAGVALVDADKNLDITISGAGAIQYQEKPENVIINKMPGDEGSDRSYVIRSEYGDSTRVKLGGMEIKVIESDSTTISIGRHNLVVDEEGDVRYRKNRKKKFNGHWGGFEIGINGYLTPNRDMNFSKEDEYLDLRMEKSIAVHLNIIEQNFALSRNKQFGVLTGLGMEFHNYRFRLPTTLTPDSSVLVGYVDRGVNVRKSKLVVNYFVLPVLFEWQTNQYCKKNSFHVTAGVVLGVRFSSHTKKYYNELNKKYYLTRYDAGSGDYIPVFERVSPGQNKERRRDDYHLHPFKVDGSFRIGWGFINLFANYSFTTLFRKDRGPELYPFSVGISLLGW